MYCGTNYICVYVCTAATLLGGTNYICTYVLPSLVAHNHVCKLYCPPHVCNIRNILPSLVAHMYILPSLLVHVYISRSPLSMKE